MSWSLDVARTVATVTYDNPPENRVPFKALADLDALLERISTRNDVKVVVLRSATEGTFSAGADLADVRAMAAGERPSAPFDLWAKALLRLEEIPQPTVAFIDGIAASGGFELALACTFRLATTRAAFEFRELPNGAIPAGGGTQRLPRLIGMARAAEIIMSARTVAAEEALQIGLVQKIVPDGAGALDEWLQRFTSMSGAALFAAKRSLVNSVRLPFAEALRLEQDMYRSLIRGS